MEGEIQLFKHFWRLFSDQLNKLQKVAEKAGEQSKIGSFTDPCDLPRIVQGAHIDWYTAHSYRFDEFAAQVPVSLRDSWEVDHQRSQVGLYTEP